MRHLDVGISPEVEFGDMRAGVVTARDETCLFLFDDLKGLGSIVHTLNPGCRRSLFDAAQIE
jgi:hypothetical protein